MSYVDVSKTNGLSFGKKYYWCTFNLYWRWPKVSITTWPLINRSKSNTTADMRLIFSMIELLLRLAQRAKSEYRFQLHFFSSGPLVVAHSSLPGLSVNRIEPYALPIFIRVSANKNDTFLISFRVHIIIEGTRERTGCLADLFSLSFVMSHGRSPAWKGRLLLCLPLWKVVSTRLLKAVDIIVIEKTRV